VRLGTQRGQDNSSVNWQNWDRVLLQKLIGAHLIRRFPDFIESEGSLPCSKMPSTGPYPERNEPNSHPPILFKIYFNIILPSMPKNIVCNHISPFFGHDSDISH
jgi:hypothetical protein